MQETVISYTVIYEHGPNEEGRDTCSAYVPDLTGVVSCGDTREECERMIREAIELYIETLRAEGLLLPMPSSEAGVAEIAVHLPPDENSPEARGRRFMDRVNQARQLRADRELN